MDNVTLELKQPPIDDSKLRLVRLRIGFRNSTSLDIAGYIQGVWTYVDRHEVCLAIPEKGFCTFLDQNILKFKCMKEQIYRFMPEFRKSR
jgi:hypothetical protein